ncbi:unnamed protein product [Caenorhabditis bovis]|uniref:Major facilitator superfamily (MFS) profile domain-containing protein n=1 Tax=Caenorhabditis bovis TaxID=2654633 RepID=A0A8S1DZB2_9PELO|nr:unnamed protein product [Caenorhabditis bovis]
MKVVPFDEKPVSVIITPEYLSNISKPPTADTKNDASAIGNIRYIVLLLSALCLSSIMSNVICFNFTVLCMPGTNDTEGLSANKTEYMGYNRHEKTLLFSAVAVGALFGVFPISMGISRYGSRIIFFACGTISSIATAVIPIIAPIDVNLFLLVRFIQGLVFSVCLPIVGAITSAWASLTQQGLFIAALTTFGQLSSVFSMPVAGELCTSEFGWQSVYYVHALVSFLLFLVWYLIFTDRPDNNRLIKPTEIKFITNGKQLNVKESSVPYLEILTTPSIWGIFVGAFGDLVAVQLIHIFSPLYLHQISGYSVEKTGFAAAVPVLFQFIIKLSAGHSSDKIRHFSETFKLRVYNTMALGVSALFLVALAFAPEGNGLLGLILLTIATAMFGFNGGGFNKCAALVSRQYSHFVMANIQVILCLSMLACPILVGLILEAGTLQEWRIVFLLHAGILFLSNAFFCWFATAQPAPWTNREISESRLKNTPLYQMRRV